MSRSLEKWSQNRPKIHQKLVPSALPQKMLQNVCIFSFFQLSCKRPMCLKHSKYHIETMFFAWPRAPHFFRKHSKNHTQNHPKILSKWCPEAFQKHIQKKCRKKLTKYKKNTKKRPPRRGGESPKMTSFFHLEPLWGPRAPQDDPRVPHRTHFSSFWGAQGASQRQFS